MLTRLLTCGACAVLIAASQVQSVAAPVVNMILLPDGGLQIEGHRYATPSAIRAEIDLLKKRKPTPQLCLLIDKHITYDTGAKMVANLARMGIPKFAVLTEPMNEK